METAVLLVLGGGKAMRNESYHQVLNRPGPEASVAAILSLLLNFFSFLATSRPQPSRIRLSIASAH